LIASVSFPQESGQSFMLYTRRIVAPDSLYIRDQVEYTVFRVI
jgi:hypothetical protein